MSDEQQKTERRHFHRIIFDTPVTISVDGRQFAAQLKDISLKGALVSKPNDWSQDTGAESTLDIQLAGLEQPITMQTNVAHVDQDTIGFFCHHIDMESITQLRRLIELNLGESELLERDLMALGQLD